MHTLRLLLLLVMFILPLVAATAFAFAPPPEPTAPTFAPPPTPTPPSDAVLKAIKQKMAQLTEEIKLLRAKGGISPFLLDDIEIYVKAATWIVEQNEFYTKDAGEQTLAVLDQGLRRAIQGNAFNQLARGEAPWLKQTGRTVIRGYRSSIDASVQPYAVTLPVDYGVDATKKWRLDVVLHGRSDTMTEVSFINAHSDKAAPKDLDRVIIDIYGRGNNAYRWAGEGDVNEAVDRFIAVEVALGRGLTLDPNRQVLRGFSMGGAGTWHLGLHRPDRWCVIGPGAGFTTTRGYVALPEDLRPEVASCLHIYDAVDYAENAFNLPVVAYSGSEDKQMAAARNIEEKLKPLGIPMTHLVAPGLAHSFPAEWQKKAEAEYAKYVKEGKPTYPKKIHFVTYTLRYSLCNWVDILSLDEHYKRTVVDAEATEGGFTVKTANVRALHLTLGPGATEAPLTVTIDGQKVTTRPYLLRNGELNVYLEKRDKAWVATLPERMLTDRMRTPQKTPGLQGPIDDAFTGSFLCVVGNNDPWNKDTEAYAQANVERFRAEWSKYFRGDLKVIKDDELKPDDIATKNLILFGDPGSNSVIEQVMSALPFKWTKDKITWAGQEYASADHVPVLVYPNPLNKDTYVVLNSGHTFHAADFQASNANLYPRLGDFAILKLKRDKKDPTGAEVVVGGLFDEYWRVASGGR